MTNAQAKPSDITDQTQRLDLAKDGRAGPGLELLYSRHRGKGSDKWTSYFDLYDRAFARLRERPVRILEVGIQNGGSLDLWLRYFPNAQIVVGCDIDEKCRALSYDDPRIHVVVGDAGEAAIQNRIAGISDRYDIIIDDGSHKSSDIIRTFAIYYPYLTDGGLYVAEDLHASYWQQWEGHLYAPYSSLSFFKRLVDVINAEHWDTQGSRDRLFAGYAAKYAIGFERVDLASIHSVTFNNSACVIEKADASANTLGRRRVAGHIFDVYGPVADRDDTLVDLPDELTGFRLTETQEELLDRAPSDLARMDREIAALTEERDRMSREIAALSEQLKASIESNHCADIEAERFRQIAKVLFGPYGNWRATLRGLLPFSFMRRTRIAKLTRMKLLDFLAQPPSSSTRERMTSFRDFLEHAPSCADRSQNGRSGGIRTHDP